MLCLLFFVFSTNAQSVPFLKVIKDSANNYNYGKAAFIEQDSLYIHLVYNSDFNLGGFCNLGNGSVYYVKLKKTNGQIISTKVISAQPHLLQVNAGYLYKSVLYLGGEIASPFNGRSAFIMKFNTQTNNIIWQRNFNSDWFVANSNYYCATTDIKLTPDKSRLLFYGSGRYFSFTADGLASFRGNIDTNNTSVNWMEYGYQPSANNYLTKPKFGVADGGMKAFIITMDSTSKNINLISNLNYNSVFSSDFCFTLNLISTGNHYITNVGKKVVYLIDKLNSSTCILADSLNNILISKEFNNVHARGLISYNKNSVLTFVNDIGSGKGTEIINVKIDTAINIISSKKMFVDTFEIKEFTSTSSMDNFYNYNLFSKKSFTANEVFVYKHNFTGLLCNEQPYAPNTSSIGLTSSLSQATASMSVNQTTFVIATLNKTLKDSNYCYVFTTNIDKPITITKGILIYPNPSSGKLNVSLGDNRDAVEARIFNYEGKQVYFNSDISKQKEIDLMHCSQGLYLMQMKDSKGNLYVKKFVIE